MPDQQGNMAISLVWTGIDDLPVQMANMSLIQITPSGGAGELPEEFIITTGYAAPPVLLGTEEEQRASAAALGAVAAKALARFSISRSRLQELVDGLSRGIAAWDQKAAGQ